MIIILHYSAIITEVKDLDSSGYEWKTCETSTKYGFMKRGIQQVQEIGQYFTRMRNTRK